MQTIRKDQWKTIAKIIVYFTFIFFFQRIFAHNTEIKPILDPNLQIIPIVANDKALLLNEIDKIETSWGEIYYANSLKNEEKEKKYLELLDKVELLMQKTPQSAELIIWKGILTSNVAGVVGPLTALSKAKAAMNMFREALTLDPRALNGSAYVNLAMMLHQMPWPTGNDEEAEKLFKKALKLNSDSLEANFYYGMFLVDQDRLNESVVFFTKASQIQPRANQVFVDTKVINAAKRLLKK